MSPRHSKDVEARPNTKDDYAVDELENEPLLSSKEVKYSPRTRQFSLIHIVTAFLAGILVQFFVGIVSSGSTPLSNPPSPSIVSNADTGNKGFVPPYVGSTEVHNYPPTKPTGVNTKLFPTNVGYPGTTHT